MPIKLKGLSTETMIATSGFLLEDPLAQSIFDRHELGVALANQLRHAHGLMVDRFQKRTHADERVSALTEAMSDLDMRHDSKARSLYYHLKAFVAGSDDGALSAMCERLLVICFPEELELINASYSDEAGWARSVRQQVSPETVAFMETVTVGGSTLADVFRSWIDAGVMLGLRLGERARVQSASMSTGVDAASLNLTRVRSVWIRTVRLIIDSVDVIASSERERDALLSPIQRSVDHAERMARAESADDPPAEGEAPADGSPVVDDGSPVDDTSATADGDGVTGQSNTDTDQAESSDPMIAAERDSDSAVGVHGLEEDAIRADAVTEDVHDTADAHGDRVVSNMV